MIWLLSHRRRATGEGGLGPGALTSAVIECMCVLLFIGRSVMIGGLGSVRLPEGAPFFRVSFLVPFC